MTGVGVPAAGLERLAGCRLFIFDLDGTVYEETDHFRFYGEQIARALTPERAQAFAADVEAALSGRHTLTYGSSYDAEQDLIFKGERAYTWTGEPVSASPSAHLAHMDDPWGIYMAAGLHHGAKPDQVEAAFLATRAHMESPEFQMRPLPGLRAAIDGLRALGRRFALATNSPEPDSRKILAKLDLTGAFDVEVFNARKQHLAREHFTRFQEQFQVPFEQMVSIGDHYRNEIAPAAALGMATVYIDRYLRQPRPDVTVQVARPADVAKVLRHVTDLCSPGRR
jgi:FMN phosphatase YigB (HAD superfamily)